eukprot:gene9959-10979_t
MNCLKGKFQVLCIFMTIITFFQLVASEPDAHETGQTTSSSQKCPSNEQKYNKEANIELSFDEMFKRGHMKPFGSHKPPDYYADELPFMISPDDFYMNYVVPHKPVVLKGAAKNWPAYKLWTDSYLKEKYGNETVHMETKDDDKYNIPPAENLGAFLDKYREENSTLYLVDEVLPKMREEIVLPLCLRCEEIDRYFFVSFLWLSGGNTMSTMHIDTDENLLCVLKGHKRSILVSPIYSKYLYADDSRVKGVCDVNTSAVDLEKFPDVTKIKYWVANAGEGDCVYIPQMWWHHVYSRKERQLAVALWWKSKPFWKEVLNKEGKKKVKKFTKEERAAKRPYSYSDTLIDYEEWVKEVAPKTPRIACREQQVLMSKYNWETDKYENAPTTLGDGGNEEENLAEEITDDVSKVKEALKKKSEAGENFCSFSKLNKQSPCYFERCYTFGEEDFACLKYILDYCGRYDDRGCVINKPHLLNKKEFGEMEELANAPSLFKN